MTSLDPLLQPLRIKHLELRNRVVSTSHEPAYGENGMPKERYRRYHVEKARGGVGLTMIGGSAVVSADSPASFGNLLAYRDEIVPWFRALADEVHDEGAAVMCQLTHLGWRTSNYTGDWLPLVSVSSGREPAHRSFTKTAEPWDLDRIVADYAAAAERCRDAGLDGIELQHYGHFLDGFLSPDLNHRDDAWNGDLSARLAFPRRVIQAVRAAVGSEFILGIRMSMEEDRPGGLGGDEALAAAQAYVQDGIDLVSTVYGTIGSDQALARLIPGMGTPSAPFLDRSGEVRRALGVPVMHAARIQDVSTARHALREGLVDLVGMTRPQLADPYLVHKVATGQEDRIRPCVGASYCLDSIYQAGDAKCIHNPATGRELSLPHEITPGSSRRRAVVVGGGPAGLEAARVLGARGHQVTLFEANAAPGGQVALAATSPRRRDLMGIIDWRVSEARHAGVDLRLNTYASREDILAESPDLVIVATGGVPDTSFLTAGADLVLDTWDVMSGALRSPGHVLVYDDHNGYPAMDAVEALVRAGARVDFVTPERMLAEDVGSMNSPAYLSLFAEHDVQVTLAFQLREVRRAAGGGLEAVLWSEYADREVVRTYDQVVVEHGTTPVDELYHSLLAGSRNLGEVDQDALLAARPQSVTRDETGAYQLFRIGDAVASRNIHAAVLDALRLCAPL
nr:NADH:flavin oxidoreductase [Ornithinimicrobium cavernae]